jgi:2-polyprenyl-6-methoxyphenol hydroxylase-like FAD-dependent oxidoreductase
VFEKHANFLRDFRGDTVHPSTLRIMDELSFGDEFLRLPHTKMTQVTMEMPEGSVTFADFRKLPEPFRYVAFMPQWDFLNFLTGKARHFSNFELLVRAEVTGVIEEADRAIVGVRAETPDGPLEVHCELVVAADERHSVVRAAQRRSGTGRQFGPDGCALVSPHTAPRGNGPVLPCWRWPRRREHQPRRLLADRVRHPQGGIRYCRGHRTRGAAEEHC